MVAIRLPANTLMLRYLGFFQCNHLNNTLSFCSNRCMLLISPPLLYLRQPAPGPPQSPTLTTICFITKLCTDQMISIHDSQQTFKTHHSLHLRVLCGRAMVLALIATSRMSPQLDHHALGYPQPTILLWVDHFQVQLNKSRIDLMWVDTTLTSSLAHPLTKATILSSKHHPIIRPSNHSARP